jgi:RNA polymerase sigma-70 factor (ECF subfamily)
MSADLTALLIAWGQGDQAAFDDLDCAPARGTDLMALDDSLEALAAIDPRKSKVVELKFFGGLTTEEIAGVLEVSPPTVLRDWKLARSWLRRDMKRGSSRHDS